jgi:hypothetical protein
MQTLIDCHNCGARVDTTAFAQGAAARCHACGAVLPQAAPRASGKGWMIALVAGGLTFAVLLIAGAVLYGVSATQDGRSGARAKFASAEPIPVDKKWPLYESPWERYTARFPVVPHVFEIPATENTATTHVARAVVGDWTFQVSSAEIAGGDREFRSASSHIGDIARQLGGTPTYLLSGGGVTSIATINVNDEAIAEVVAISFQRFMVVVMEIRPIDGERYFEYFHDNLWVGALNTRIPGPHDQSVEGYRAYLAAPDQFEVARDERLYEGLDCYLTFTYSTRQSKFVSRLGQPSLVGVWIPELSMYARQTDRSVWVWRFQSVSAGTWPVVARVEVPTSTGRNETIEKSFDIEVLPMPELLYTIDATMGDKVVNLQPDESNVLELDYGRPVHIAFDLALTDAAREVFGEPILHVRARFDSPFPQRGVDGYHGRYVDDVFTIQGAAAAVPGTLAGYFFASPYAYGAQQPLQEIPVAIVTREPDHNLQPDEWGLLVKGLDGKAGGLVQGLVSVLVPERWVTIPVALQPEYSVKVNPDSLPEGLTVTALPDNRAILIAGTHGPAGEYELEITVEAHFKHLERTIQYQDTARFVVSEAEDSE